MNNKKCAQHTRNRSLQFCLFEFAGKLSRNMSRFNRLFVLVFLCTAMWNTARAQMLFTENMTLNIDSTKTIQGTLNPVVDFKTEQENILQNYSKILKKGGKMVYATCSILPSENGEQVRKFLSENTEFALLKEENIMPSDGYDGFYMALIERK